MANKSLFYDNLRKETFYSKEEIISIISDDYIRGLIEGEGCFGNMTDQNGVPVPAFMLKMHARDKELIEAIRDYLKLRDKVYEYNHQGRHFALLQVRDTGTLKNIIVPFFRNKLLGFKGTQFAAWLNKYPYLNSLNTRG